MRTTGSAILTALIGFLFLWPGVLMAAIAMPTRRDGDCAALVSESGDGFLLLFGAFSSCPEHVLVRGMGWALVGFGLFAVTMLWFGPLRSWRQSA